MRALVVGLLLALAPFAASAQSGPTRPMPPSAAAPSAHGFSFEGLTGGTINLADYRGKAILVVNTASKCGLTPQYKGLQALYDKRSKDGLVVIGVPSGDFAGQELATSKEIAEFCELNYGVTFPMAAKSKVTGAGAHPFYRWAAAAIGNDAVPRWNFHKILLDRNGRPVAAFGSRTQPEAPEVQAAIQKALGPG